MRKMNNYVKLVGTVLDVTRNSSAEEKARANNRPAVVFTVTLSAKTETGDNQVKLRFYTGQYKKDGDPNKMYDAQMDFLANVKTVAEHGQEAATRLSIGGASLEQNQFYASTGELVNGFDVRGAFLNVVVDPNTKDEFTASTEVVLLGKAPVLDKDGVETGALKFKGFTYDGYRASEIPFVINDPSTAVAFDSAFEIGTVTGTVIRVNSVGDFSSETKTVVEQPEIGEPVERTTTVYKKEISAKSFFRGEADIDMAEVKKMIADKQAALEEKKVAAMNKPANAPVATAAKTAEDFGFGTGF